MIILDANTVPTGPAAGNAVFPVLEVLAEQTGLALAIPAMVLEESCSRLRREVQEAHEQLVRGLATIEKYTGQSPFEPKPIDDLVDYLWREQLEATFVILDAPEAAHKEALLREARRIRPAREGRGARDALIWLTVLHHVRADEPNFFVSNNTKDFGRGELFAELRAEVPDNVQLTYCNSLNDLLDQLATRSPTQLTRDAIEGSEVVHHAVRQALTGPPYFFAFFRLTDLPWAGSTMSAGEFDVHRIILEDSATYGLEGRRYAGARCRVTTRHYLTVTNLETEVAEAETLYIDSQQLLLLELDGADAITEAQVLQISQPLRRGTE